MLFDEMDSSFLLVFFASENAIFPTRGPSPTVMMCVFVTALEPLHASLDTVSVTFILSPAASRPAAPVLYSADVPDVALRSLAQS